MFRVLTPNTNFSHSEAMVIRMYEVPTVLNLPPTTVIYNYHEGTIFSTQVMDTPGHHADPRIEAPKKK